jgi:hypothetical protein
MGRGADRLGWGRGLGRGDGILSKAQKWAVTDFFETAVLLRVIFVLLRENLNAMKFLFMRRLQRL